MPTGVSGLAANRFGTATRRLSLGGQALVTGSTAQAGEPAGAIVPGGNIAMALSYGDLTAAGVGTVTAVCGDAVLAFGHPFALTGQATASLHGADALYVQRDSTFGSFKVANPTAPVGVFTQDRMAGILGRLGTQPKTAPVTITVTTSEGDHRSGTTSIVDPRKSAQLATMHLMANLDAAFNGFRGGTGRLGWTITVRREDGTLARLTYSDIYASSRDVTGTMPWDFYLQLSAILDNGMEKVDLVRVQQQARLNTALHQYELGKVQVHQRHRWVTPRRRSLVTAHSGNTLRVRARLVPAPQSSVRPRWVRIPIDVPGSAHGIARLMLHGGSRGRFGSLTAGAKTLPNLMHQLATAPTNNTLTAQLQVRTRSGKKDVERRAERSAPITGMKFLTVAVR
jgi:hypothetical protein